MTAHYAQAVYSQARKEVAELGYVREATQHALWRLGHSDASVALLEANARAEHPNAPWRTPT